MINKQAGEFWPNEFCPHHVVVSARPFENLNLRVPCAEFQRSINMFGAPILIANGPDWGPKLMRERPEVRWIAGNAMFYFKHPQDAVLFKLTFG